MSDTGALSALKPPYLIALCGGAPWLMFLPSIFPPLNVIAMAFILMAIPLGLIGLAAPVAWLAQLGGAFTRHGRVMLWALPSLPVAFSTYPLLVLLYRDLTCGSSC